MLFAISTCDVFCLCCVVPLLYPLLLVFVSSPLCLVLRSVFATFFSTRKETMCLSTSNLIDYFLSCVSTSCSLSPSPYIRCPPSSSSLPISSSSSSSRAATPVRIGSSPQQDAILLIGRWSFPVCTCLCTCVLCCCLCLRGCPIWFFAKGVLSHIVHIFSMFLLVVMESAVCLSGSLIRPSTPYLARSSSLRGCR
jgi:hypothetical protein